MRSASESERDYESESMKHESEEKKRGPYDVGREGEDGKK